MSANKVLSLSFPGWDPQRSSALKVELSTEDVDRILERLKAGPDSAGDAVGIPATQKTTRGADSAGGGLLGQLRKRAQPRQRLGAGQPLTELPGAGLLRPRSRHRSTTRGGEAPGSLDAGDPRVGRWALVVLEEDREAACDALQPLLARRAEQGVTFCAPNAAAAPGVLAIRRSVSTSPERWLANLQEAAGESLPTYLLLVGGPDRIPFELQYILDAELLTGRLDVQGQGAAFWAACRAYADKVVRFEQGRLPVQSGALLYSFGTDGPTADAREYLAGKLAAHISSPGFRHLPAFPPLPPTLLFDSGATTAALLAALSEQRPALVFTTSHGLADPQDWGALTDCSFVGPSGGTPLSARVVPAQPFAPGAIVFSFACFSAGVPKLSALGFLFNDPKSELPGGPCVSPLPRKLLAHPEGPIAFIGHVDLATSGAFAGLLRSAGPQAFIDFFEWSIGGFGTIGQAMYSLRAQFDESVHALVPCLTPIVRMRTPVTPDEQLRRWIRYYDSQGYMLLGDPVLRVRDGMVRQPGPESLQ